MPDKSLSGSVDWAKAPAYELFFALGKQTMRPGGVDLTRCMLEALDIGSGDDVVEFAPGMGATTRIVLGLSPASYTAVERNGVAQRSVQQHLKGANRRCVAGKAEASGLEDGCASVVFGEAMLTMQTAKTKTQIVSEARRLLREGGRYAIHETCIQPDDLGEETKKEIESALTEVLRVGARPLTLAEWRTLLEDEGFSVQTHRIAPLHLLEPRRVVQDEGLWGALRFASRIARHPAARRRILAIRNALRRHSKHLGAVTIVVKKGS